MTCLTPWIVLSARPVAKPPTRIVASALTRLSSSLDHSSWLEILWIVCFVYLLAGRTKDSTAKVPFPIEQGGGHGGVLSSTPTQPRVQYRSEGWCNTFNRRL